MKPNQLMEHFETLAEKLGLRIIQGKGDFNGGGCIIRQDKVIVLNKMKPIEQRPVSYTHLTLPTILLV